MVLCLVSMITSCIDKDYDLSQINTDDIAIGDNQSEFKMPLATIHFSSKDICNNTSNYQISLKELYDEADIWFPTTLPDGANYIDIYRILNSEDLDSTYLLSIVNALEEELQTDATKRNSIASHIATKYRNTFINALTALSDPTLIAYAATIQEANDQEAAAIIAELIVSYPEYTTEAIKTVFVRFLEKLNLEDIDTTIPRLDISQDIRDMLLNNLDDISVTNPANCLYIYGQADNRFPFIFQINTHIDHTSIDFGDIVVNQGVNELNEVRVMRGDMQRLLDGTNFRVNILTLRYYPHLPFTDDTEFCIQLHIRKTGALQF